MREDLISVTEAAAILGLSRIQVGNFCRQGLFQDARKIGERWVIPREAVLNFTRSKRGPKSAKEFINAVLKQAAN